MIRVLLDSVRQHVIEQAETEGDLIRAQAEADAAEKPDAEGGAEQAAIQMLIGSLSNGASKTPPKTQTPPVTENQ